MTDRYAVIGNPIGHSKSPAIHTEFARQTEQDLTYTAIEGRVGGVAADFDAFRAGGGRGLNVTAPFKLDAFAYASTLHEGARLAGAVNCLTFGADGITGSNFDGIGLVRDIAANLRFAIKDRRVLLLGAGGAARGALLPLLQERPAEVVIVNRTVAKAVVLTEAFASHGTLRASTYAALADERHGHDLVINATSASLSGELPPIPSGNFAPGCLAYEMVYGKGLTPFLRRAKEAGVRDLADGVGMLVEQAAEAFALWRGVRPETRDMIVRITVPLV